MDTATLIRLRQRTNIPVTEEAKHTEILGALQSKAKLWSNLILPDIIPILKALVIVTLWLTSGLGYTPIGCKTQYLFSDRYWYNKQLVIFFIIYFIINVGGEAVTKLKNPVQEFALSIITWLLFNIIGRLGKIWLDKSPWFWPSPLTWFGAIALPLVTMYILDDIRRYFIAEHALKDSERKISLIKNIEMGLIGIVCVFLIVGFIRALLQEKKLLGKSFAFIPFFFGLQLVKGKRTAKCTAAQFLQIRKELKKVRKKTTGAENLLFTGLFISVILGLGYLLPYYEKIKGNWKDILTFFTKPKKTFSPKLSIELDKATQVKPNRYSKGAAAGQPQTWYHLARVQ